MKITAEDRMTRMDEWAKEDAKSVKNGEHLPYFEADIRKRFIKIMVSISEDEKEKLYDYYCSCLSDRIAELSGGRRWGELPAFS